MAEIETEYLVIGAGASGMAFTDALVADADVDVVIVDRRHNPGGHWNDAYPFVRLHQPSATYGVNSRPLGTETIDAAGPNAGFYERATGVEICDYFRRVLDEQLVGSGQVRFFGQCDYVGHHAGEHSFRSRLTGGTTTVRVRRKIVDATYLETSVPATHTPEFTVGEGVKLIPVGELVHVTEPPSGFTVLGAGKTGMDACSFLLDNNVDPDKIRWVRPRDAWLMNRSSFQPLDLVASTVESLSLVLQSLADAENVDDLFRRLASTWALRIAGSRRAANSFASIRPSSRRCSAAQSSARLSTRASGKSSGSFGGDGYVASRPAGSCSTRARSRLIAALSTSIAPRTGCGRRRHVPSSTTGESRPSHSWAASRPSTLR